MPEQERWEAALEDKLCGSTPDEVRYVVRRLRGWLVGYCAKCGLYSDLHKGPPRCACFKEIEVG
jgi:hypothetical protein